MVEYYSTYLTQIPVRVLTRKIVQISLEILLIFSIGDCIMLRKVEGEYIHVYYNFTKTVL
jgi:hypothetical protein